MAAGDTSGEAQQAPWVIDTHTHFYDPTRPQGVPWPSKGDRQLYRPVLPPEYRTLTRPHQVVGTVVVEASGWVEDNQWVLDLAEREPFLVGLVGHLDPGTPDFPALVQRFAKNELFRGIRIGSGALAAGLAQDRFRADLRRLADLDLELDVNGGPAMLPDIARLGVAAPGLRVVINHVANLRIDGKTPEAAWQDGMRRAAAASTGIYCKVSALVEGAAPPGEKAPAALDFYRPVLDTIWQAFGEDRLVYGSNWPVSDRAAPYGVVQRLVSDYFAEKGAGVLRKVLRENSRAAYKWKQR